MWRPGCGRRPARRWHKKAGPGGPITNESSTSVIFSKFSAANPKSHTSYRALWENGRLPIPPDSRSRVEPISTKCAVFYGELTQFKRGLGRQFLRAFIILSGPMEFPVPSRILLAAATHSGTEGRTQREKEATRRLRLHKPIGDVSRFSRWSSLFETSARRSCEFARMDESTRVLTDMT